MSTDKKKIRIRQQSVSKFEEFRNKNLTEGISAVLGITKDGKTEVQSFVFDKSKFNLKKAKEWVKSHNGKLRENFSAGIINTLYSESSTEPAPVKDKSTEIEIPSDITELYPDVKYNNGKINKDKVTEKLNELSNFSKLFASETSSKIRKMLMTLLKESYNETLHDKGFNLQEGENSFTADDFQIILREGINDSSLRRAKVRLIKSGESKNGNHYSGKCLREATHLFDGLPIYPNHSEDKRKVEEKVGFYSNPEFIGDDENGEIHAVANILESEKKMWDLIKEQFNFPNAKLCGFSINAFGKGRILKENGTGRVKRIVDSIVQADSTDIVDNPSAGGKVLQLLESVIADNTKNETEIVTETLLGEEVMDEKTLREKHPEIVKSIEDAFKIKESEGMVKCADCGKEFTPKDGEKTCPECSAKSYKESFEKSETEKKELSDKLAESELKMKELESKLNAVKLKESIDSKLSDGKYKLIPIATKNRLADELIKLGEEVREGDKPSNWDEVILRESNYVSQVRETKDSLILGSEKNDTETKKNIKLSEEEEKKKSLTVSRSIF